jgi:hypothetical protein
MNHTTFAEHEETYEVDGKYYTATANFVADIVMIKGAGTYFKKVQMEEYIDFDGNMEDFVKSQVGA